MRASDSGLGKVGKKNCDRDGLRRGRRQRQYLQNAGEQLLAYDRKIGFVIIPDAKAFAD